MKINLMHAGSDILSGFLNLDDYPIHLKVQKADLSNLNEFCEDAECTIFVADDVIDYFSSNEVDKILRHWISKIRHKGTLIIGGTDLHEICKAFMNKHLDLIDINNILFGSQKGPEQLKKSALTMTSLCEFLESHNFKIIKKRTNQYRYVVEAQRK